MYIGSTGPRSGKSLLSFSLGILLQKAGYSVGYMKPLGRIPQKKDELLGDADALVVQEVLGQNAPADILTPVMIPGDLHGLVAREKNKDEAIRRIRTAYEVISTGKDITLVSGSASFPATGRFCHADGLRVLRALGLKIVFVERYAGRFNYDALLYLKDMLGPDMLGVVLNDVPHDEARDTAGLLVPYLREHGVPVLGVLGHEPGLAAMRVTELAQGLNGHIAAGNSHASRMVDSFLIGAMQVDNFMLHLRQRSGCAVIVGGDRADLQLAALHAAIPCIILTGNIGPPEFIRSRAEDMGTAILCVRDDAYAVTKALSRILMAKKLRDLNQIRHSVNLVENTLDIQSILDRITNRIAT
jgi:BioD-like phosphotransacetylase family protein